LKGELAIRHPWRIVSAERGPPWSEALGRGGSLEQRGCRLFDPDHYRPEGAPQFKSLERWI